MTHTMTLTRPGSLALAFLMAAVLLAGLARAETTTQTALDDDPIVLRSEALTLTRSEFDDRFRIALANVLAQQGQPFIPEMMAQFASLRPQFLEDLAFQAALLSEAERRGLSISDEEIDEQLELATSGFADEEEFGEALSEAGFRDVEQFRETVRESELLQRVVEAIREDIEVGDDEIAAFYEANAELFERGEEICARHILVETREEAEALAEELAQDADFAELAAEHSLDPGSAQSGGDLDCQPRGIFVPEFEEAAFDTPEGEVSEPVETQFGYHLIQPYDRVEAGVIPLEEVEADIRQNLQAEGLNARITSLRDEADVEIFEENLGLMEGEEAFDEEMFDELFEEDPEDVPLDEEELEEDLEDSETENGDTDPSLEDEEDTDGTETDIDDALEQDESSTEGGDEAGEEDGDEDSTND